MKDTCRESEMVKYCGVDEPIDLCLVKIAGYLEGSSTDSSGINRYPGISFYERNIKTCYLLIHKGDGEVLKSSEKGFRLSGKMMSVFDLNEEESRSKSRSAVPKDYR